MGSSMGQAEAVERSDSYIAMLPQSLFMKMPPLVQMTLTDHVSWSPDQIAELREDASLPA